MPASYVQLAPDGTGKKLRARQRTVGANVVYESRMRFASDPTWLVWCAPASPQAVTGRIYLAFLNNAGSGQVLRLRKLFLHNAQLPVLTTGVAALDFNVVKITALTTGTAVTPNPMDTADGALSNITCVVNPGTITEAGTLYTIYTETDEIGVTGAFSRHAFLAGCSTHIEDLPYGALKEHVMRPGEGFAVRQVTAPATIAGSFAVLAVITKDV